MRKNWNRVLGNSCDYINQFNFMLILYLVVYAQMKKMIQ